MGYSLVLYGFEGKNQGRNWGREECHYDEEARSRDSNIAIFFKNTSICSEECLNDSGYRYKAGILARQTTLSSARGSTHS
jgi:hypothetical protein